jgi:hypothetical protein
MKPLQLRPYRKLLTANAMVYFADEEYDITIKNLSISGVLAQLVPAAGKSVKEVFDLLSASNIIDLFLPGVSLAGEVEVVRLELQDDHIVLGLQFKDIAHCVNNPLYKRKAYRKKIAGSGFILLNDEYLEFNSVNVSVDGILIYLNKDVPVEVGTSTVFEFKQLELEGEIQVKWVEPVGGGGKLMGLQFLGKEISAIKGIPNFH